MNNYDYPEGADVSWAPWHDDAEQCNACGAPLDDYIGERELCTDCRLAKDEEEITD